MLFQPRAARRWEEFHERNSAEKRTGVEWELTYNLSVNSRMAYSELALQTQDLDARKANSPGLLGDFGGR